MIEYENECCDCAAPAYPCLGERCPRRRVPHYYCDNCECEATLYHFDGHEWCADCIIESLEVVEGSKR